MSKVERALLGEIALDPAVVGAEVLSVYQDKNPFSDDTYRRIYHAWATMPVRTVWDTMAIVDKLERSGVQADWFTTVRAIQADAIHTAQWREHNDAVMNEYNRRISKGVLENALYNIETAENVQEFIQAVSKDLINTDVRKEVVQLDPRACVQDEIDRLARGGLSTGISSIDELIGPLEPGEVLVVAARTSVGKSLLVGNIIRYLSVLKGIPGLVHSFEMPVSKCISRLVASMTHINSREVLRLYQSGDAEVKEAYEKVFKAPIVWDERGSLSIAQINNKLRRCVSNHGVKYCVLDHVGFIRLGYGKKNEELGKAIKEFKTACKELGVIPIIVVQLNRSSVEEEPGLHHLKSSGDIEEDASQVILLHRDTILTAEERQRVANGEPLPMKVGVAKTRYGETGYKKVALFLHSSLIQDNYVENEDVPK